jgi:hypothetical protein
MLGCGSLKNRNNNNKLIHIHIQNHKEGGKGKPHHEHLTPVPGTMGKGTLSPHPPPQTKRDYNRLPIPTLTSFVKPLKYGWVARVMVMILVLIIISIL